MGKDILKKLLENVRIAREERILMCQDTGVAVLFAELGQEVSVKGGGLHQALEEGIRQGYKEVFLRNSVLQDPRQVTGWTRLRLNYLNSA